MRALAIALAVGAVVAVAALLALVLLQRRFIYPVPPPGAAAAAEGFVAIELPTEDRLRLRALHRPAAAGRSTLIFFHGNGDSLRGALAATDVLAASGYGVLLPEYRGYGGNPGRPSESGLHADGRAALAWLKANAVPPADVIPIGNSLGSGVAIRLAADHDLAGVVVISGFTSLPAVAADAVRLPVAGLIRDRFDNARALARVEAPALILHGDADRVIPVAHARELARVAKRATYREFAGAGHELAWRPEAQAAIAEWLMTLPAGTASGSKREPRRAASAPPAR